MKPQYWKNPKPETVKKWIDNNKQLYSKEIKELSFIVEHGVKDNFTISMYNALVSGRKITDKMLDAIHNIIKRNTPKELSKKLEWQKILIEKGKTIAEIGLGNVKVAMEVDSNDALQYIRSLIS